MLGTTDSEIFKEMYALVGEYLHHWAAMESKMNDAIGEVLGLDTYQTAVVCSNINFRSKCHILKTAIQYQSLGTPTDHQSFVKMIDDLVNISYQRNMVAHDIFFPNSTHEKVKFFSVKAKGKFSMPHEEWAPEDFEAKYAALTGYYRKLSNLCVRLKKARKMPRGIFGGAYPTSTRSRLAELLLQSPPPPVAPPWDMTSAIPEITPQTPEEPEESES